MASFSSDRLALLRAALAEKGLATPCATGIPRRAERGRAPLSEAQQRLFFLELYEPGTALHNDAVLVWIEGDLDPERLMRAVASVAERHEILRTTFTLSGNGPVQCIHPALAGTTRTLDRRRADDAREAARALAREDARRPFDLEQAPPWRLTLVRLGEREWALALTLHHLLSDGASMGLFFDELSHLYAGEGARLTPLAVQFGDYAAWEGTRRDEDRAARDLVYWREVLGKGLPTCAWPGARGHATQRGAQVPIRLEAEAVERLGALARSGQVTTNHLLLAAWFALLGARSGQDDLCTGMATSLRQRRELEPLLGFFVQSLPLRVRLAGDPDCLALARTVRAAALEAQAHGALAFDRILRAAEPATHGAAAPTPLQTFFSHMKDAIRAPSFAGSNCRWEFVDPGVARFELALVLHESAQGLCGFLEHDLGLFEPAVAARLVADYTACVGLVLAHPARRLSALLASSSRAPRRAPRSPLPSLLRREAGE